jgi:general secretion pathway protein C
MAEESESSQQARSTPLGPCGGIEARLITLSEDPEWTFASLAPPGEPAAIRHVGDRVGHWRIDTIEWDRVWLRAGGTRCAVGMHVGARAGADDVGGTPESALAEDAPARPASWQVPREIVNAIEKLSSKGYVIDRAVVGGLFERAGELLAGIQLTPIRKNEIVTGVRLSEIKKDSLLDRFGVESGDTLLAINGTPTTTLEATIGALETARKKERLVARLDRVGKSFELEIVAR